MNPLKVIATPIGNSKDLSLRAIEALIDCENIICEDRKTTSKLLREHNIKNKNYYLLNEHNQKGDLSELIKLCQNSKCVLVSDCGTPGFCDPGAELIDQCYKHNITIEILPGASSLMAFLSGSGLRIDSFYFRGFLPANTEERIQALKDLQKFPDYIILMDTPYRLEKTLDNISQFFPKRKCTLGTHLTQINECFYRNEDANRIKNKLKEKKAEFVLAIHPIRN